jgi:hypothetical protein
MRYEREMDSEIFDEDEVMDAVDEMIEDEDMEEAAKEFDFRTIWKHLDEEMRMMIWDRAREMVLEEQFMEPEEEEEDE